MRAALYSKRERLDWWMRYDTRCKAVGAEWTD